MVSSAGLIETISERLKLYNAKNIVVDPVMISTSGSRLIQEDALETILLTPNIPEASVLSGISIANEEDMIKAAEAISSEYGCAVLCKGGHSVNNANDLLYRDHKYKWFKGERIDNSGLTMASAVFYSNQGKYI